jgi:WD40 repeat protein
VIWEVALEKRVTVLSSPLTTYPGPGRREVTAVAISPDNKYVVSSSPYSTLTLWEVESGELIGQFKTGALIGSPEQDGGLNAQALDFSPDGKKLVVGATNGITLWDIDPKSWKRRALKITGKQ